MEDNWEQDYIEDDFYYFGDDFIAPEEFNGRVVCFVMDYSLSVREIIPAMAVTCYDIMDQCLRSDGKSNLFGLVTYANGEAKEPVFTDNPSRILEQMLAGKVGGGSENGVEDTAAALRLACESLKMIKKEDGSEIEIPPENRIVFLFTDSIADESVNLRKMTRTKDGLQECPPVRAAVLFVPTEGLSFKKSASLYQMPLVDAEGRIDRHRAPYIFPLESVVSERVLLNEEKCEAWIDQLLAAIS